MAVAELADRFSQHAHEHGPERAILLAADPEPAVRCGLPKAEAKPLDGRREELSHGGSPRERGHQCEAREGGNRFPP